MRTPWRTGQTPMNSGDCPWSTRMTITTSNINQLMKNESWLYNHDQNLQLSATIHQLVKFIGATATNVGCLGWWSWLQITSTAPISMVVPPAHPIPQSTLGDPASRHPTRSTIKSVEMFINMDLLLKSWYPNEPRPSKEFDFGVENSMEQALVCARHSGNSWLLQFGAITYM